MRKFVLMILLWIPLFSFGNEIIQIRREFYAAVTSEQVADNLFEKLKDADLRDPLILAYYGSTDALRAKHAWNPYTKVAYLKSGLKNLNKAVSASQDNLEIRFLRFSLEHYVPAFLGFSKHLNEDRKKIVALVADKRLGKVDETLLANIVSFMKQSGRCTDAELAVLSQGTKGNG